MDLRKRIFLSYKSSDLKDRKSATAIKKLLEEVCSGGVHVFTSNESIRAGDDWAKEVNDELRQADYLIFLYTDPSAHWEWCHFEAGLFLQGNQYVKDYKKRIFCIHPAAVREIPSPLNIFENIRLPNDKARLLDFLSDLYAGEDPIRRLWFVEHKQAIHDLADNISQEVYRMAVAEHSLCSYVILRGKEKPLLRKRPDGVEAASTIPDSYVVESNGESLKGLFDKAPTTESGAPWTWGELKPLDEQRWVSELATGMAFYIAGGTGTSPIRTLFRKGPGEEYTPILTKVTARPDEYTFEVLFLEQNWNQRDRTDAVPSFKDLMERLIDLVESTDEGDTVRFLAYTPAIGFLAESKELWERLYRSLEKKCGLIEMICLTETELTSWHSLFKGKATVRPEGKITETLIKEADDVSAKLIELLTKSGRPPIRKKYQEFPGFYLFKNAKRALVVAPVGVPILNEDGTGRSIAKESRVEMFGLDTNSGKIIGNAGLAFSSLR